MIIIVICSVNGMSDQKPLPHASTSFSGLARMSPSAMSAKMPMMTVPASAKMNASGIHRSVSSVAPAAMRSRRANPPARTCGGADDVPVVTMPRFLEGLPGLDGGVRRDLVVAPLADLAVLQEEDAHVVEILDAFLRGDPIDARVDDHRSLGDRLEHLELDGAGLEKAPQRLLHAVRIHGGRRGVRAEAHLGVISEQREDA